MQRSIRNSVVLSTALFTLSLSHGVQAAGLLDQGKSVLGGGSASGAAGLVGALPLDQITKLLQKQGYSNITGLAPSSSGDTLQASAINSAGSAVNLLINPKTGGVLSALPK
jgi:hypothetical protein